jgi:hypothetical protein
MIKKIIASTAVVGALTFSSLAATASPIAFESVSRVGSVVSSAQGQDDEDGAGIPDAALVVGVVVVGAAIIYVTEGGNSTDDLPASP